MDARRIRLPAEEMKGNADFVLPLHRELAALLRRSLHGRRHVPADEPVLGQELGAITTSFKSALRRAELPEIRWHDLRHTYASLLLTNGAPIAYVSDQMGHASIELTVKRYGHLIPGVNRHHVNALPGAVAAAAIIAKA